MDPTLDRTSKSSPPSRVGRLAAVVAFATVGAVLTVLGGLVRYPDLLGPVAYLSIAVIGSVAGGALAVLGFVAQAAFLQRDQR